MSVVVEASVRAAVESGAPVVGLESSNITGGTFPANLELAHELDSTVREHGATPARIAVLDGRIHVGLTPEQLERLARSSDTAKVGSRDLAATLHRGLTAGTTVSASLIGAAAAGLTVFAVAGIGGVHRGAATSFDISTDLTQLARTPLAVVCAGAKSLLDPRLTLEYLETLGVPVIGYRSESFPAYLAVSSGEPVPLRSDDLGEIAAIARRHWAEVGQEAVLVTAPVPAHLALDEDVLRRSVDDALDAAAKAGVTGAPLTPFVLSELARVTQGASSLANRAALVSTVAVAAQLAVADARLRLADAVHAR